MTYLNLHYSSLRRTHCSQKGPGWLFFMHCPTCEFVKTVCGVQMGKCFRNHSGAVLSLHQIHTEPYLEGGPLEIQHSKGLGKVIRHNTSAVISRTEKARSILSQC